MTIVSYVAGDVRVDVRVVDTFEEVQARLSAAGTWIHLVMPGGERLDIRRDAIVAIQENDGAPPIPARVRA